MSKAFKLDSPFFMFSTYVKNHSRRVWEDYLHSPISLSIKTYQKCSPDLVRLPVILMSPVITRLNVLPCT